MDLEDGIVIVTSNGNVGIGTDDVDVDVTDANTAKLAVGILTASKFFGATFSGTSNQADTVEIDDVGSTSTLKYLHFGDSTDGYDEVEVDSSTLVFKNRNLGIGLNDPTSKLHVDGTSKITGVLTLTSDTDSTSKTTGALVVEHGVGIGSNLTVGENLNVTGIVSFAGPSSGQAVKLATNGGITTTGGDLYVGGDLHVLDDIFYDEISGRDMVISGTATINELKLGFGSTVSVGVTGISTDLSITDDVDNHDLLVTAKAAESFIASQFDSVTLKFTGDSSNNGTVLLGGENPQTFLLSGTPNQIVTVGVFQSITIGLPNDVTIGQDLTVSRDLTVNGDTTLGNDVNADTVTFTAKINSNFLPNGDQNIGASDNKWKNVFAETVTASVIGIASTATSLENAQDFSIDGNTGTNSAGDVTAAAVSFDGTDDVIFRGKLKDISSLTAGDYGDASTIPQISVNSQGLITNVSNQTVINVTGSASKLNPGSKIGINTAVDEVEEGDDTNAGKVKGTGINFTGENDISINANLMDSGAPAGAYGDATTVPRITVNSQGLITNVSNQTVDSSSFQVEETNKIKVNATNTTNTDTTPYYVGFVTNTTGYADFRVDTTNNLVYKNGKFGIGTNDPQYTLDLGESSSTIRLVSENNGTAIRIGAGGDSNDVTLLRIDGSSTTHDGESNENRFGFSVKYMGSGLGNLNTLSIFSDDTSRNVPNSIEAVTILQDGTVGIGTNRPDLAVGSATTSKLAVGIVTANEYYGTFKGTIDGTLENTVVSSLVSISNTGDSNSTHYIHMGSETSGSDGIEVDSNGLVYKNRKLGIGEINPNSL